MTATPRLRPAARAVVLDRARGVLLVHFDVAAPVPSGLWACPGGGIEPGESLADGLRRELREELGLAISDPGRVIWRREHHFPLSELWDGQHDSYFLVEVAGFEPRPALSVGELQAEHLDACRWWSFDDLHAAQASYDADPLAADRTTFSPRRLAHLVDDLLARGRPPAPVDLEPP